MRILGKLMLRRLLKICGKHLLTTLSIAYFYKHHKQYENRN